MEKLRPLEIPATNDKVLQFAVAKITEAIYEEDFLDVSYGYRRGTGPQDAMLDLNPKPSVWKIFSHCRGRYQRLLRQNQS
jgi:retron-type reverse transcriptase